MSKKDYRRRPEHQTLYNSKEWQEIKRYTFERTGGLCERCREEGIAAGILPDGYITQGVDCHHIIPFESAKTTAEMERLCYDPNNCVLLCIPCHQRAHKEGYEAGGGKAWGKAEDVIEVGSALPVWGGREKHGELEYRHDKEVDGKTHPDNETCLAVAPHLGDAVVQDIRDGKEKDCRRKGDIANHEDLGGHKVGNNKAGTEQDAKQHVGRRNGGVFHILFFTWCSSTRFEVSDGWTMP